MRVLCSVGLVGARSLAELDLGLNGVVFCACFDPSCDVDISREGARTLGSIITSTTTPFGPCASLTHLDLSSNQLQAPGALAIAKVLGCFRLL